MTREEARDQVNDVKKTNIHTYTYIQELNTIWLESNEINRITSKTLLNTSNDDSTWYKGIV